MGKQGERGAVEFTPIGLENLHILRGEPWIAQCRDECSEFWFCLALLRNCEWRWAHLWFSSVTEQRFLNI